MTQTSAVHIQSKRKYSSKAGNRMTSDIETFEEVFTLIGEGASQFVVAIILIMICVSIIVIALILVLIYCITRIVKKRKEKLEGEKHETDI